MNWYNILKFAFPVIEKPSQYDNYFEFGHKPNATLWFVDRNYNFYNSQEYDRHTKWPDFMVNYNNNNIVAVGRYDPDKLAASYRLIPDVSLHIQERFKNKIETILDKKFNNPAIMDFTI